MIRLEGDTLPQEARGAVPPILFGDLLRDVPGIPLQVGWVATLADNCGIDVSTPALRLGGADLAETLAAVPAAGVVQIENEWLRYSKILADPPRLTIAERGYRGTVAAAHAKGATVWFVETRPLYAFAYVPAGCSYPDDALVQLRVNDNAEVPPCTVRLQDDRVVPGERLLTVEFDASRGFYVPPPPVLPSYAVLSPSDAELAEAPLGWHIGPPFAPTRPAFAGYGGVAAPSIPRGRTPGAVPFAGNGGQRVVRLRQGALGRVTADLRGLRDTAAGRYSGVPLGPLVHPAAITRLVLEDTYEETDGAAYHAPTWATTAARHAARGLTWRLLWRGEAFETFRDAVQRCGQADLYLDEAGRWRYRFRDPVAPAVGTLTPRELLEDPPLGWSGGRDVVTELEVAWGAGLQGGTLTLESPYMIPRHGRNHGAVTLPYAASEAIARTLARYHLARRDRPRQSLSVKASHATLGYAVTDRVFVDTPLLRLYGARRVPFEIVGITDRGDQRVLALLEADPLAQELLLSGSVFGRGLLALDLSGSLDVLGPMARPLSGTLVLPRSLSRLVTGTLVHGAVITRTLAGTLAAPGTVVIVPLTGTLVRPGTLSRALAGTRVLPGSLSRTLAGTRVAAGSIPVSLSGSLEAPATLAWDAVGATWDAVGATWDGPPPPAPPPAVGTVTTTTSTNLNTPVTASHTTGPGETFMLVKCTAQTANAMGAISSVTFGGTALTLRHALTSSKTRGELWGGTVPAGTTATVTVTGAGYGFGRGTVAIVSYTGVVSLGTPRSRAGAGGITSSTLTLDEVGAAVLATDFITGDASDPAPTPSAPVEYGPVVDGGFNNRGTGSAKLNTASLTWTGLNNANADSVQIGVPLIGA